MDVWSTEWKQFIHEPEMEDSNLIRQCQMDSSDHSLDEFVFNCISPDVYSSYTSLTIESTEIGTSQTGISTPAEELKTNNGDSLVTETVGLSGHSGSPFTHSQQFNGNLNEMDKPKDEEMSSQANVNLSSLSSQISVENLQDKSGSCKRNNTVCATSRAPLQAKNHILAERKRRERLNQTLISLSALIPGLKKMDKASILQAAMKYIKQLKENVQTLENETKEKWVKPTVLSVKRRRLSSDDDTVSSEENMDENFKQMTPEVVVRVSDKDVLVRIHCEKSSGGLTEKILSAIQALHLNVISTSILSFGNTAVDMTVIAQMDNEFHMTVKDLVEKIRLLVLKFT